jgi:hypothetical protein
VTWKNKVNAKQCGANYLEFSKPLRREDDGMAFTELQLTGVAG